MEKPFQRESENLSRGKGSVGDPLFLSLDLECEFQAAIFALFLYLLYREKRRTWFCLLIMRQRTKIKIKSDV